MIGTGFGSVIGLVYCASDCSSDSARVVSQVTLGVIGGWLRQKLADQLARTLDTSSATPVGS